MNNSVEEISRYIKERNINIYGVSEIVSGEEHSCSIVPAPWSTDVYSVSKFISAAAVGLLYDEGKIDLNAPVTELISDCPVLGEPRWKDVTLHDCLRHRTGLVSGNLDIDDEKYEGIDDWLSYILNLRIEGKRDVDYHYTDAAFYLVCRAAETAANENVFSYLHRKLFRALEFRESSWSVCPQGFVTGGSGFCANDRDLARVGYLWANNGRYKGRELLSPEYIRLSLENGYGTVKRDDYTDCYYKTGANGQIILMLPSENRSVAIRGFYSSDIRTELVDRFFTDSKQC